MVTSCSKQEVQEQKGIPMSFYAEDVETVSRVLLDGASVNSPNNQLKVYDRYSLDGNAVLYMDGTEVTCNGSAWTYSPLKYWTETGTHSFTAYLSTSGSITLNTTNYPTVTYDKTSETLNISPWEITLDNQFDFLYAYHSRKMNGLQDAHRPVAFSLNHLLCAVQFNVVNLMPEGAVTFNEFRLEGVYHTGNASITGDASPVINLTGKSAGNFINTDDQDLPFNIPLNVFKDKGNVGPEGYVLLWPHTQEQFKNANINAVLSYQYGSTVVSNRAVSLSTAATNNWRAGNRYIYNFYIQDNRISFEVKVVPWVVDDVIIEE